MSRTRTRIVDAIDLLAIQKPKFRVGQIIANAISKEFESDTHIAYIGDEELLLALESYKKAK